MSKMMLSELLKAVAVVESDVEITSITLDSRAVTEGTLFIALHGVMKHAVEYAEVAEGNGAAAIIWETDEHYSTPNVSIPCIAVADLRSKAGEIANRFFGQPSAELNVIGITGTDGKTTVSNFIAQALNQEKEHCAVIGTLGKGVPGRLIDTGHTTPDVITVHETLAEMREEGIDTVAMEVSSHALDQGRILGVDVDVAVLTNLSRDHLDYHETLEAYAQAKARLFAWPSLKTLVVNLDDAFGQEIAGEYANKEVEVINYCVGDPSELPVEYLVANNPNYNAKGIQAGIHFNGQEIALTVGVIGTFNLHNILATIGALLASGYSLQAAVAMVEKVETVPGRMERVENDKGFLVVVDYAHTPMALEQAIEALKHHTEGDLITVFGCGGDRDRGKRPKMAEVAERLSHTIVMTDDNPRSEMPFQIMDDMIRGLQNPEMVAVVHNRTAAIRHAFSLAGKGDTVLVAGKGHETVQIVGDERRPFDDREQAQSLLKGMPS
ncbi:MAG: UDP-N-acetylmuramoylalanyl-D-glutamate--2,6-diaminopimelate ligase (EC [uncultured Thiotrichaceae bacterium]|uniref:UDP-N-acetylmuramoyl-L-alanyl-D-glutamate--2,6-diaminopimelate ligase n=1 Tax=uncultured Thiotrichaceae bacterium TaxID=298394 RepID=A0A6S6TIK4_9GAMM|nr:MAG: UDP-N-acetylmuramoylalanyl-D-glutamate--2,6-diaminopimelate ligase (EC [uncultured Thiotrichaceae bacterium]